MHYQHAKEFILKRLRNDLPETRTYHCFEHTMDVYSSAIDIAEKEGVNGTDLELLKLAALYHDCGFMVQDHDHEEAGCKIATEKLTEYGYSEESITRVCDMIMATKIPQSPKNQLEKILCDADLDYLGRSDFFLIGDTLYEEFMTYGVVSSFEEWNKLQVSFLESHTYCTDTSKELRHDKKAENLQRVKDLLENKKASS